MEEPGGNAPALALWLPSGGRDAVLSLARGGSGKGLLDSGVEAVITGEGCLPLLARLFERALALQVPDKRLRQCFRVTAMLVATVIQRRQDVQLRSLGGLPA